MKATLGGGTRSRPIKYISNCNLVNNGFSFEDIKGVPLNGDSCSSEGDWTFYIVIFESSTDVPLLTAKQYQNRIRILIFLD